MLVSALVVPRLLPQRRESPRRYRVIALYAALTTTVRVIHGVHGHTANGRANTHPARAAGLAERFVLVIQVADLANRGHAVYGKLSHFAGRQLDQRQIAFFAQQLSGSAGGANQLAAAARIQLNVVHHRARRNVPELQRIAGKDVGLIAGAHRCSDLETDWVQDVALVAIRIVQQRNVRAAVWIVFDRRNLGRNPILVAPEVYLAVLLLVSAAAVPNHHFAVVVAAARTLFRLEEPLFRRLLGDFVLVEHGHEPSRCCVRIKALQSHRCLLLLNLLRLAPAAICFRCSRSGLLTRLTSSPRIRSSFRRRPVSRKPFSSRGDSLRFARGAASCPENSRFARRLLSP